MASPQIENGHIDIATTIADKFCSYRLSGQEWQIIWVVLRKTWGWLENPKDKNSPKKKIDRISLSQFEQLTGIDRRKCHELLKKLTKKKVLKKAVTQKGDKMIIRYGFQKDFDRWLLTPKKVTVTQKGDGVSPKKVSRLSPKKVNTNETLKETLTKDTAFDNADFYITKKKRKITGKRLETFMLFWEAFDYKRGKAEATDVWIDLQLTNNIVDKIIIAAEAEAKRRPNLKANGEKPKMAQGWLSGKRWEDETGKQEPKKQYTDWN